MLIFFFYLEKVSSKTAQFRIKIMIHPKLARSLEISISKSYFSLVPFWLTLSQDISSFFLKEKLRNLDDLPLLSANDIKKWFVFKRY